MKVLMPASEVAPIIKLGGLGDVVGSLPKALEKLDVDADVIVPYFPSANTKNLKIYKHFDLNVPFNNANYLVTVFKTKIPGSNVDVFLAQSLDFFSNWNSQAFANNYSETEVFTFFSKVVVEYIKSRFNTYDVIHCNDWHTGLITHLLSDELGLERPGTLFTIHNLMYQGVGEQDIAKEAGFVPGTHRLIDWDLESKTLNLLKQGVTASDFVNTVSESYAKEIMTPEFGKELAPVLQDRQGRIVGILNGIDYDSFPRTFDLGDYRIEKKALKSKLQKNLGLTVGNYPIFSFVSRLDPYQKGLDILFEVLPIILEKGGQVIILGTGDATWEGKLRDFASKPEYAGLISVNIKFNAQLAVDIYAGSDFFLVPSRYEPCGLTQMIAMWYGTLPIVHAVGGLKDSVISGSNGFTFDGYNSTNFISALNKAFSVYADIDQFHIMVENAMREDFSWKNSALVYKNLYEKIVKYRNLNL